MADDTNDSIIKILKEHAEEEVAVVTPETTFKEMGIDSLGLVEIIFDLEEKFDITIPEPDEIEGLDSDFNCVGDVVKAVEGLIAAKG